jgi:hypothetical protein
VSNVDENCRNWRHNWFGFYRLGEKSAGGNYRFSELPDVRGFIDGSWQFHGDANVINYLKSSLRCAAPSLPAHEECVICGQQLPTDRFHWDGKWLWPESLVHYVLVHSLRLPDRMISDLVGRDFVPPKAVGPFQMERLPWPPTQKKASLVKWLQGLFKEQP